MKVFRIINPDSITNIYFVTDNNQTYGVLINPGNFSKYVYKKIKEIKAEIKKILITHGEPNQIDGIPLIKKIYNIDIYAIRDTIFEYQTIKIKNNSIIKEGELSFKVIETPIHSYDSASFLIDNAFFVGDILQAGTLSSLDKNRAPNDFELKIIEKNVLSLPDNVVIYPGKGPPTTVEIEKKFNPYFQRLSNDK